DEDTKALPSITGPPFLRFYAAAPIITNLDICIGVLCVVHDSVRQALSEPETVFLQGSAKSCMEQLEMIREVKAQRRGLMMSDGTDSFIQHREGVYTNTPEKIATNIAKGEGRNSAVATSTAFCIQAAVQNVLYHCQHAVSSLSFAARHRANPCIVSPGQVP
ncbi:hypothetical protein LTR56_027446, partial [Elasticomyces elasticus]